MARKNKVKKREGGPVVLLGPDLFRLGLRLPITSAVVPLPHITAAGLAEFLLWLEKFLLALETPTPLVAGFVSSAYEAAPTDPEWFTETGKLMFEEASKLGLPTESPEWNDYYLGRYAYSGNVAELQELIRRARNRDGSTSSILLSSATCDFLYHIAETVPEAVETLKFLGFDPAAVKFGSFPPADSANIERANPRPAPAQTPPGEIVVTGITAPKDDGLEKAAEPPAGVFAIPDLEKGLVYLSGKVPHLALSLTSALNLLLALTESTQLLFKPAEGFAWIDDIEQLAAALVVLDEILAKRLGLPERSGVHALRMGLPAVWLAGELVQSTEDGPQFGRYKIKMFRPGTGGDSFEEFGNFEDFNDAKFELAKRVRANLATLPPE